MKFYRLPVKDKYQRSRRSQERFWRIASSACRVMFTADLSGFVIKLSCYAARRRPWSILEYQAERRRSNTEALPPA